MPVPITIHLGVGFNLLVIDKINNKGGSFEVNGFFYISLLDHLYEDNLLIILTLMLSTIITLILIQ